MFSNTAYEALYQYIGLSLHAKSIELITSQKVFGSVLLLIFGVMFLWTTLQFFSRYIPGALVQRRSVPLSRFVKVAGCLFLGMAILKVGTTTTVKRFNGESWAQNPYIHGQIRTLAPEYRVSFLFDILSRTAEETAAFLARTVDQLLSSTHSELDAPDFFYKAIAYSAASTIDDPDLKNGIHFYTEECLDRMIPLAKAAQQTGILDSLFSSGSEFDTKLAELPIATPDRTDYTCLDAKNELMDRLRAYADQKVGNLSAQMDSRMAAPGGAKAWVNLQNLEVSNLLANQYLDTHEGPLGLQKGAELPTSGGRIAEYLNRLVSVDGILSVFGMKSSQGIWLSASQAKEFSENLARAPHVAGFIKMLAIAVFPWLIFFIVAGRYQVLYAWFWIYFSVLLWAPVWTLLYHIMLSITLSAETMAAFGKLGDGISLYGATLINARFYHMYEVYSWLQLLTGSILTGSVIYFVTPILSDRRGDSTPEFLANSSDALTSGVQAGSAIGTIAGAAL